MKKTTGISTVLGLVDEFKYMDMLIQYSNPSLTKAIYEHEKRLMI